MFLGVERLCVCFVRGVFKVRSEKSQMFGFLRRVELFGLVKLSVLLLHLLTDDACVADTDVVVGTARNLLTELLQTLS